MAKMGRPPKDVKADKRLTIRFNEEEYEMLLDEAEKNGMTVSQLARLSLYQTALKNLNKGSGDDEEKDEN